MDRRHVRRRGLRAARRSARARALAGARVALFGAGGAGSAIALRARGRRRRVARASSIRDRARAAALAAPAARARFPACDIARGDARAAATRHDRQRVDRSACVPATACRATSARSTPGTLVGDVVTRAMRRRALIRRATRAAMRRGRRPRHARRARSTRCMAFFRLAPDASRAERPRLRTDAVTRPDADGPHSRRALPRHPRAPRRRARARCRSARSPSASSCRRAARIACWRRWSTSAGPTRIGVTGFYRLTMRLAILGQRFYLATGVPDICQPLLDRLARRVPRVRAPRGGRRQRADVDRARAGRHRRARLPARGGDAVGAAVRDRERQGVAATMTPEQAARKIAEQGGFEHADRYGPNVDPLDGRAAARAARHRAARLRHRVERGRARRRRRSPRSIRSGADRAAVGTVSIAGPERAR